MSHFGQWHSSMLGNKKHVYEIQVLKIHVNNKTSFCVCVFSLSDSLHKSGILIPRSEANSYLVKRSAYYEQGIVCECCYHRCSLRELLSYCRNDTAARFGLFKRSVANRKKSEKYSRHKRIDSKVDSND